MQISQAMGLRWTKQVLNQQANPYPLANLGAQLPRRSIGKRSAGIKVVVDHGDVGGRMIVEFYNLLMSDIRSNSSYAISAIEFNSKSLNPLDSLNPAVVAKIKREAEAYHNCAEKCQAIWNSLAKNDMAGANLTEKVLEVVFREYQADLYSLTRISSIKDFMRIFDTDHDGTLNPDEQIGIFSFIKERLELVANNCLQIQLYVKFEALMTEVRALEAHIAHWQDQLREKVHRGQLTRYRQEGENRVDEFCAKFDA